MKNPLFRGLALFAFLFVSLWAQSLKLPGIFSDHLVLQSGEGTPVFGWAAPGAQVQVYFAFTQGASDGSAQASAVADKNGRWLARLPKLAAGQRGILSVNSNGETVSFKDALVGEVWLCSGQSNMQRTVSRIAKSKETCLIAQREAGEIADNIRMFRVKLVGAQTPQDNLVSQASGGGWEVVSPKNVLDCTAVGWNFAFDLFKATNRPIGILSSNWGGTPVESWTPKTAIDASPVAASVWKRHETALQGWEEKLAQYKTDFAAYLQQQKNPDAAVKKMARPKEPYHPESANVPSRLYNAMIHPLEPYGLAGVIWYQGESNSDISRVGDYGALIQAMVASWRAGFQNPNLPFYYVELANYMKAQETPMQTKSWAYIREQQNAVLALPRTGVATAIDVGEAGDIHPEDKKTVANRLAGLALNDIYGNPSLCRSPEYVSSKIEGNKVVVQLANADGLRARTEKIGGFAIAGMDGQWVWAESVKILPHGVLEISSAAVSAPVAARYAWASNPVISLENGAGLPLRPFRTDPQSKE